MPNQNSPVAFGNPYSPGSHLWRSYNDLVAQNAQQQAQAARPTASSQPSIAPGSLHSGWQIINSSIFLSPATPPPTYEPPNSPITEPEEWPANWGDKPDKEMPSKKRNKSYNIPLSDLIGFQPVKGEIGLEIECEGKNLFNVPISYWSVHQDHSLRAVDDHPPVEYVLKKPLSQEESGKALKYLENKLKETGSTIENSSRTSVHVHVNCSNDTLQDIYKFIGMYIIYEELLTEWCGPDRIGNLFCLRSKDAEGFLNNLEQAIRSEDYASIWHEEYRYMGCNTASLRKFGSLEFRTMRGTVDKEIIELWIDILLKLKERALKFKSPREIVEYFQRVGPIEFYENTFPKPVMFRNHVNLVSSMWDGLRMMRDFSYAIKWETRLNIPDEKPKVKIFVHDPRSAFKEYVNDGDGNRNWQIEPSSGHTRVTIPVGCSIWQCSRQRNTERFKYYLLDEQTQTVVWRSWA